MKKMAIIYHSISGNTKAVAELVAEGAKKAGNVEIALMDIEHVDEDFVNESIAVIFGTPTYYANMTWQMKKWFDTNKTCKLEGKIGSMFATCNMFGGGSEIAVNTLAQHLITKGMLVYSGGTALGAPFIHVGSVLIKNGDEFQQNRAKVLGERVAAKALEVFGDL